MDYRIHFKMYLANAATKLMSGFFRFCKAGYRVCNYTHSTGIIRRVSKQLNCIRGIYRSVFYILP